jgi:hypothetical protein
VSIPTLLALVKRFIRRAKAMSKRTSVLLVALVAIVAFISFAAANVYRVNTYFRAPVDFAQNVTYNSTLKSTVGVGAVTSGAKVVEYGDGYVHKSVFTIDKTMTITDAAGTGGYGGYKFYDLPAGNILVLGAVVDLDGTSASLGTDGLVAAADGDFSIGTATCNAGALSSTEADIIASTAIAQFVTTAGPIVGKNADISTHDGTSTAKDLYVNVIFDDADSGANDSLRITGNATVWWINLGDL